MEASQNGKRSMCYRFCCMKQTFKSLISQLISARVFSEKPGDSSFSSGDREERQKTGRVGRSAILIDDLAKSEAAKAAKPGARN